MKKLYVGMFMSLDGVVENPMWTFPYWNDDIAKFKGEEGEAVDCLLLGRKTYDGFAQAWPTSPDEGAAWMNGIKKYVLSTTLETATWNNTSILRTVDEVKKLKEGDGAGILVYGGPKIVETLIQHDLVDQFNLLVYPVVRGGGDRFFLDGIQTKLKLVDNRTFQQVVLLVYEPDRSGSGES